MSDAHKQRHFKLHHYLDELCADYLVQHPGKLPSTTTMIELMQWSCEQMKNPTGGKGVHGLLEPTR